MSQLLESKMYSTVASLFKKAKNCKKTDSFDVKAEDACALTCGAC